GGGEWWGDVTEDEEHPVEERRRNLSVLYGRVKPALEEALGGIPILSNAYVTAGELFSVALADPSDNPWLGAALDGSVQSAAVAVGYFERRRSEDLVTVTSPVYWWRRGRSG